MESSDSTEESLPQLYSVFQEKDLQTFGFSLAHEKLSSTFFSCFPSTQIELQMTSSASIRQFQDFEFNFQRGSDKFITEVWFYVFYNVMNEKYQLIAAEKLAEKGYKLHRKHLVWVRQEEHEKRFYFNLQEWKFVRVRDFLSEELIQLDEIRSKIQQCSSIQE